MVGAEQDRQASEVTEAVVLAAGEGSRLWPVTTYQPKPMVQIGHRPILEYVLAALVDVGIERVTIVVGHKKHRVQNHLEHSYRGVPLNYVHQKYQLGSGHALQQCESRLDGPFLVVNGDTIVDTTLLGGTVESYHTEDSTACVAVVSSESPDEYGSVRTRNNRIVEITERSGTDRDRGVNDRTARINAGVYVFDTDVFEALSRVPLRGGERDLPAVVDVLETPPVATAPGGFWCSPTYPWELLTATEAVLTGREPLGEKPSVHGTARIDDTAVVGDNVSIEADSVVHAGAVVGRGSCLHENSQIGPNSVIDRSILGPDVRIGANTTIRDSIVGRGVTIGDGTVSPGRSASVVINGREYTDRRLGAVIADRVRIGSKVSIEPGTRIAPNVAVPTGAHVSGDVTDSARVIR